MKKVQITETVLRDANQSLMATRLPYSDYEAILPEMDKAGYYSAECWGGATFDSCLRYLNEDPWERLRNIRKLMPNTKLQMLLRGQNLLGYKHYHDDVVEKFVELSIKNGIDILRIFDALNDFRNIQTALDNVITEQNNAANVMANLGVANMDELANQVTVTLKPATETPTATVEVESSVSAFEEGLDETVAATAVTIAEAKAKRAFLEQQLADAKAKALANITPEADEVLAALAEGQDWDTLAEAHNDDPGMKAGAANAETGYPVCEGFTQFDAAFVEGAMALQNVGDYSDKIEGSYGYYIIQYTSDVAEGAVDMETVRDTISSSLLSSKQSTVRDEVVAQWVKDANATINKGILND